VSSPTALAVSSTVSARGQLQANVGLKVMIGSSRAGLWGPSRHRCASV
jgi:hypothetical protein